MWLCEGSSCDEFKPGVRSFSFKKAEVQDNCEPYGDMLAEERMGSCLSDSAVTRAVSIFQVSWARVFSLKDIAFLFTSESALLSLPLLTLPNSSYC